MRGTTSACAENTKAQPKVLGPLGNYLRVRGEYPPTLPRFVGLGTTSACAENTTRSNVLAWYSWNYLRVRGEYHASHVSSSRNSELPPRARRILPGQKRGAHRTGTTSACAENTNRDGLEPVVSGNYLRVRGEYPISRNRNDWSSELPPRARRIPAPINSRHCSRGTTSACAENTWFRWRP